MSHETHTVGVFLPDGTEARALKAVGKDVKGRQYKFGAPDAVQHVLQAMSDGPKTITDLAGGSLSYRVRAPIRAAVDELMAAGGVRRIGLGRARAFVESQWKATPEFLRSYMGSLCGREGAHLIWEGDPDQYRRCVLHIDSKRYDVRRTLYEIKHGVKLHPSQSLRAKCEHEMCMSPACQMLINKKDIPGMKHTVITKQRLADAKRANSKYGRELVEAVKASEKSYSQIARETGMKLSTIGAIKSGRLWQDYSNPFAGLLRAAA